MKILFVSMPSVHVIRWIENLKDSPFELFWYDILNRGPLETLDSVTQISGLQKRKLPYIKGEYFLSKKTPDFYQTIRPILEVTENEALEKIIKEVKPDIIHSFEMQSCSYPIVKTMKKFPEVKWLYSCWGNDLFYFKNFKNHQSKIKNVLKRVDFLHTDCLRDFTIATELGFKGNYLGVVPGGTGYKIAELKKFKIPFSDRKIILVKGYQHLFGRALNVIKALEGIQDQIAPYQVVVFGAHTAVQEYIRAKNLNFTVFDRHGLSHEDLMQLMGKSLLYIGNNISDGMPNTMLEAIVMGAFPIQSNPGGATAEIIQDGINGLLINHPDDIKSIQNLIVKALKNNAMLMQAFDINRKLAAEKLEYEHNKNKVLSFYKV